MLIKVTKRSVMLTDGLREWIERRLQFVLASFSSRIRRVSVIFSNVSGNRDKQCRLRIALIPSGEVVLEGIDASVVTAVANVADRSVRLVSRALGRRREFGDVPERVIFCESRRCREWRPN